MIVDYSKGKIYKIVSNQTNKVYISSTCEKYLHKRLYNHKHNFKDQQNKKYCYISSFEILKYDDVQIILFENYPCKSKDNLHAREQYWIDNTEN